jgi:glycosyltransferase involved in cell wall biosynthesis
MAPNKIALFIPSLTGGGAQRVMIDLAGGLTRDGLLVDLVLVRAYGEFLHLVPHDVRVVDLNKDRTLYSIPALTAYLSREKPDVILSTLEHANVAAIWATILSGHKTKVIIREATTSSHPVYRNGNKLKHEIVHRIHSLTYRCADDIVAVSHGVASDMVDYYKLKHDSISVIYNPVDQEQVRRQALSPLDHPWFTDRSTPILVSVGRLSKEKDYHTLLLSIKIVLEEQNVRLIILGEGSERGPLEKIINDCKLAGHVDLPGFVENPFPYIKNASAFVLSSVCEGLPNVLIQASYLGTPVISTDCPHGPREILDSGRMGRLVPVSDPEAMAKAISETITRIEMPTYCTDSHLDQFTGRHCLSAYRTLISKHRYGNSIQ